jgi:hypothetical protein
MSAAAYLTGLFVTGLASQYPPFLNRPEDFEKHVKKLYNVEEEGYVYLYISFDFLPSPDA